MQKIGYMPISTDDFCADCEYVRYSDKSCSYSIEGMGSNVSLNWSSDEECFILAIPHNNTVFHIFFDEIKCNDDNTVSFLIGERVITRSKMDNWYSILRTN